MDTNMDTNMDIDIDMEMDMDTDIGIFLKCLLSRNYACYNIAITRFRYYA
jgi:hypothetical protein